MPKLFNPLRSYSSIFSNFFIGAFLLFIRPWILEANLEVLFHDQKVVLLGVLVIFIILVEFIGIVFKMPALISRSTVKEISEVHGWFFVFWIGHMVVSVMLGKAMLEAFGFDIETDVMFPIVFISLVVKDMILFGYLWFLLDTKDLPKKPSQKFSLKELIGDIALIIFITFAYTLTWESLAVSDPLTNYPPDERLINGIAAFVLLLFIFFSLRVIYFIQDIIVIKTNKQRLMWTLSTLFALFAGMSLLF